MIYIDNYDSHALSFAYVIRFQSLFCFRFASSSNCGTCFRFAELDITSKDSVMALKESLEREHNGVVHCIINNAGMAYKRDAPDPFPQQALNVVKVVLNETFDYAWPFKTRVQRFKIY